MTHYIKDNFSSMGRTIDPHFHSSLPFYGGQVFVTLNIKYITVIFKLIYSWIFEQTNKHENQSSTFFVI